MTRFFHLLPCCPSISQHKLHACEREVVSIACMHNRHHAPIFYEAPAFLAERAEAREAATVSVSLMILVLLLLSSFVFVLVRCAIPQLQARISREPHLLQTASGVWRLLSMTGGETGGMGTGNGNGVALQSMQLGDGGSMSAIAAKYERAATDMELETHPSSLSTAQYGKIGGIGGSNQQFSLGLGGGGDDDDDDVESGVGGRAALSSGGLHERSPKTQAASSSASSSSSSRPPLRPLAPLSPSASTSTASAMHAKVRLPPPPAAPPLAAAQRARSASSATAPVMDDDDDEFGDFERELAGGVGGYGSGRSGQGLNSKAMSR
jgi:hypothetical protein